MLWWLLACERPLIGFTGIPPALCFPVWDSVLGMRMPFSWSLGCSATFSNFQAIPHSGSDPLKPSCQGEALHPLISASARSKREIEGDLSIEHQRVEHFFEHVTGGVCIDEDVGKLLLGQAKARRGSRGRTVHYPPLRSSFLDIDPAAELLERVQMKYIEDYEGITKYFAAFHLYKSFPTAIIIDDFGDLFIDRSCQHKYGNARGRDLAMARTMALCQDAIAYANQKQQAQRLCNLLLADTHQGDSPRLLFIYKRWVQCILTIQGDISGSFILKYSSISGNHLAKTRTAKYSIALQSLLLEDFES
ncbi:hypothetical protein MUK42_24337 [Musa troglodytarum]|uniref:Uncharacterized protein n=1 Tax=Musa troglodytarum TaxID=320322 RepID=A0A9E7JML5_9LILI|nr:hypothetical protein MUK42_24337 [Musa troglodytarum]